DPCFLLWLGWGFRSRGLGRAGSLHEDASETGARLQAVAPCRSAARSTTTRHPEEPVQGLMMNWPLMISSIISHADRCHGDAEIVSRTIEGPIHRYTYRDAHTRA